MTSRGGAGRIRSVARIAFYSFVVIVLSGVILMAYYEPSVDQVVYDGPYAPLDMASGTSLAVPDGVLQATPVVGSALSAVLFGGQFPGDVLSWFYPLHVIVLPAVLVVLGSWSRGAG